MCEILVCVNDVWVTLHHIQLYAQSSAARPALYIIT